MSTDLVSADFTVPEIFDPFFLETLYKFWNDQHFAIGIDTIDAQHLWLAALVLRMEGLLQLPAETRRSVKLAAYAREIVKSLEKHLELEDRIRKTAEMTGHEEIAREHAEFLRKLREAFHFDSNAALERPEAFADLLRLWLDRHVKKEDPLWKVYLSKHHFHPADFVKAVMVDPVEEEHSTHAMLYRQLVIEQEVISGIKKTILDDLFLLWKRFDVRTNIPLIDMQHLWLFKMVVEVEGMLHISFDERRAHLERVLKELLDYVDIHFRCEEDLMHSLGYSEEKNHQRLHEDFKRTVSKLKQEYDAGNHHSLSSLVTLLRQWLLTHIVIEDSKFGRFCAQNRENTVTLSRKLIRDKEIAVPRDQTLVYTYITARLKAS